MIALRSIACTITTLTLVLFTPAFLHGDDEPVVKVGEATPTWKDIPGTDGKSHSLGDLKDRDVVVVAVTCNHCPIALGYLDRMKDFCRNHAGAGGKVAFVAISVSDSETDRLPRMREI